MPTHPNTIRNMATNIAGVVVNMFTGLVVMPYLIRTLGSSTYGLWVLVGTMTGYFGILDLGVSAALGRLIAAHKARDEHDDINAVMSTAFACYYSILCRLPCHLRGAGNLSSLVRRPCEQRSRRPLFAYPGRAESGGVVS